MRSMDDIDIQWHVGRDFEGEFSDNFKGVGEYWIWWNIVVQD